MSTHYIAIVNETSEFEVNPEELTQLDVIATDPGTYHIIENNRSIIAKVMSSDLETKTYEIKIGNSFYTVNLRDKVDQLIMKMGLSVGKGKLINSLEAPMPGLILEVQVAAGQEVKEGDPLLVLSAMKMENNILSPRDGIIRTVHIAKDDAIDKGQLLIEFEA